MTNDDIAREAAEKVGSHYGMPGPSKAFCHRVIFNAIADATAQKDEEIAQLQQIIQQLETQLQQQDQL
jgi:hypothetical protein